MMKLKFSLRKKESVDGVFEILSHPKWELETKFVHEIVPFLWRHLNIGPTKFFEGIWDILLDIKTDTIDSRLWFYNKRELLMFTVGFEKGFLLVQEMEQNRLFDNMKRKGDK